ncbi:MAG: hypothetical protein QGG73_07065 [Candidatus Hydrogenedentes bacterium]|jgi:hypothetical protein|nr:hypothetical protein [Candidatus Hydrogenedentota bacterium]
MFFGSAVGGWIGGQIALISMVVFSAVGAAAGFYYGRKILGD